MGHIIAAIIFQFCMTEIPSDWGKSHCTLYMNNCMEIEQDIDYCKSEYVYEGSGYGTADYSY